MELSVKERLVLTSILPGRGNFKNLAEIRALREVLRITEAERVEFDLHEADGLVRWNEEKAKAKNVVLTAAGLEIIKKALEDASNQGEANESHLEVWERFQNVKAEAVENLKLVKE
jgi:hypothetical protein